MAVAIAAACARRPLHFRTGSDAETPEERTVPAVTLERETELPAAAPRANVLQHVVVLQPPLDAALARDVVRRFFNAVTREDLAQLEALLMPEAAILLDGQAGKRRAGEFWRARLSQLEYDKFTPSELYRPSQIETYRKPETERARQRLRAAVTLEDGDLLLAVPVLVTQREKVRAFGDTISFVLRATADGPRIAELVESFQLQ
jgi:hypothetical protein